MVFALERQGFTVWAVPTVILPHHPGHGPAQRIIPADGAFADLLSALIHVGRVGHVAGIVSGYLASPAQAEAVATLVREVKTARPDALFVCDPVIGDGGNLYVASAVAAAIRDRLLPLADAATPNAFECAWLAGAKEAADLAEQARALPPPVVLVTSAPAFVRGHMGNLLVRDGETLLIEHPASATPAKGTGDLVAALLLARRLQGREWAEAAQMAIASVFEIAAATAKAGRDELMLAEMQDALVRPQAPATVRRIGGRSAGRAARPDGGQSG